MTKTLHLNQNTRSDDFAHAVRDVLAGRPLGETARLNVRLSYDGAHVSLAYDHTPPGDGYEWAPGETFLPVTPRKGRAYLEERDETRGELYERLGADLAGMFMEAPEQEQRPAA